MLPEADDVDVHVDEKDLEISIAASGGPGGQGVNTTNSAVQILHKPSGIIVKCQDERSQLKNKAKALKVLKSRLLDTRARAAGEAPQAATRRSMVSTGERSARRSARTTSRRTASPITASGSRSTSSIASSRAISTSS